MALRTMAAEDHSWTRLLAEAKKIDISFKEADDPEKKNPLVWTKLSVMIRTLITTYT
jgi:hypothetical protein